MRNDTREDRLIELEQMREDLGDRLKSLRYAYQLTPSQMAKKCRFADGTKLLLIESGKRYMTAWEVVRVCRAFGVSADWLLGLSDERSSNIKN